MLNLPRFESFQQAVVTSYRDRKSGHALPTELESPTPAKLKRYSLQLLANRPSRADEPVLQQFFGPLREGDGIEEAMRRFDIEKFKPLIRYLDGKTTTTDEKNIKLLAWLIDFQPRPYERWPGTEGNLVADDPLPAPTPVMETPTDTGSPSSKKGVTRQAGWVLAGVLALFAVAYYWFMPPNHQCMYWHEDRYVRVACDSDVPGTWVIAMDEHLLDNFRKITRTDTLGPPHVNRVWYSKIDNTVEFFTAPGMHPTQPDRALRVASAYIIRQYAGQRGE